MTRSELAHLELLAEVDSLVERLERWAEQSPQWQPAEKCRALVRRLMERTASLRVRLEAPLIVATLGGTGTGKSALVNAILGDEVVQTGRARPTTIRPTLICRPNLTPEMLGIDPKSVLLVQRDLPALRDLVIVDCPDPDTTEDGSAAARPATSADLPADSNLARLRAILPKCDVLLVASTQQKYRSARVADELTAAARGAHLVFVQTHADLEDDIRDDWRRVLEAEHHPTDRIYRVDSLRALADLREGLQPRGDFADLLDLLTRQLAGAAGNRIRRANFLDLVAGTLETCRDRLDEASPKLQQVEAAIEEQRATLGKQIIEKMHAELLASRRPWENRLIGQTASRWGFSPFSLVLRAYQGIGGLMTGALLLRARTPAQMALLGAFEGVRTWRRHRQDQQADRELNQTAGWDPAELRKATIIVEGYVDEARLDRHLVQWDAVAAEAEKATARFLARAAADLQNLIAKLAKRHTGWFTRFRYEVLLLAMLGVLLYRAGKNFFYDSWFAEHPEKVFGIDFYLSAGFWLLLWCVILLWSFCRRLRRGLRGELGQLAVTWQNSSVASGLFARGEAACVDARRYRKELDTIYLDVERLQRELASTPAPR
mgnify:FL=1